MVMTSCFNNKRGLLRREQVYGRYVLGIPFEVKAVATIRARALCAFVDYGCESFYFFERMGVFF